MLTDHAAIDYIFNFSVYYNNYRKRIAIVKDSNTFQGINHNQAARFTGYMRHSFNRLFGNILGMIAQPDLIVNKFCR
jgi:hypothetical protein